MSGLASIAAEASASGAAITWIGPGFNCASSQARRAHYLIKLRVVLDVLFSVPVKEFGVYDLADLLGRTLDALTVMPGPPPARTISVRSHGSLASWIASGVCCAKC